MPSGELNYAKIEAAILKLNPIAHDFRIQLIDARRLMDEACDCGAISLAQWRFLLGRIAQLQTSCNATGSAAIAKGRVRENGA